MEVDVSSSPRDSTSDQIIAVKTNRENHKSKKETYGPACGINRSDDDKKACESCTVDENNLNPVEVENSEEVNHKSKKKKLKKKQVSACEDNNPDDGNKFGENCMANETNSNSIETKCSGEVQCKIKKVRPGKREREALHLHGQSKSDIGDSANGVSAAENGTNLPGGSIENNSHSLVGGAVANSCTELQGTKTMKRNKAKQHSCNDTDNLDGSNTLSTLETKYRPNCSSKKLGSIEGILVTENSADLGGVVADVSTDLAGGATAESDTDLQSKKIEKTYKRRRRNSSVCNIHEPSNITSAFDTECKASSNNCSSKETIVTEESAVTDNGIDLQGESKKKKKKNKSKEDAANEEVICEEHSPKNKPTSLPSSPIRSATETIPVSCLVTTENVELGLSCTSDAPVLKELVSPGKKKLIVLDINGLLADINSDYSCTEYADFKISGKLVFKRPFCADFLNFCFANFEIGVWSSRTKYNVEKAVQYLMGDLRNKLLFCWDQSNCTATNFNTIDNSRKPLVFKELRKLWEKEEPDLPWEKGRFTPRNTLLVDDSPYKALCNPPFTAIFPPPYSFKHKEDNSLGIGGDLRVYLEKMATAEHVQYYVKDNPFGQPAITDSHPYWKFYLRIIENLDKPLVSA
ncbi:FCP1 homology domain-containing protein [Carex littledalei]|uniref:FCP1 homology domain-containing protein n=1 Tax=Carex littledalei TaxID=544730 RepID=A0A833VH80_9POAL|nr:FCP1 homology domain-containing protein [Carex littledalei]